MHIHTLKDIPNFDNKGSNICKSHSSYRKRIDYLIEAGIAHNNKNMEKYIHMKNDIENEKNYIETCYNILYNYFKISAIVPFTSNDINLLCKKEVELFHFTGRISVDSYKVIKSVFTSFGESKSDTLIFRISSRGGSIVIALEICILIYKLKMRNKNILVLSDNTYSCAALIVMLLNGHIMENTQLYLHYKYITGNIHWDNIIKNIKSETPFMLNYIVKEDYIKFNNNKDNTIKMLNCIESMTNLKISIFRLDYDLLLGVHHTARDCIKKGLCSGIITNKKYNKFNISKRY